MAAVTFAGLASGLNTTSLISSLVAAAKAPETQLNQEISDAASQESIVNNLSSQVASLGSVFENMTLSSDVQFRTASASDAHVTVAASGDAMATSHDVRVEQLAQAQVTSSNTFASDAAPADGSLQIQTGTGQPASISWSANDTLDSIASKINDASAGVSASVLFDGSSYRLMLTSSKTGTANAPTFTDSASGGLGLSDPSNIKIPAQDAKVMIDGVEVTRPTNVIDDAVTGLTITASSAQAAGDPDTQVSVAVDSNAIANQLSTMVSSYNAVMTTLNQQLTYTGTTAPTSSLFDDSTLRQLQATFAQLATQSFGGMSMSDLGLTIDTTGMLSLDTGTLDSALAANPNAVQSLFVDGGMSQAFVQMANGYTEPGDGILTAKSQSLQDRQTDLQSQISQIDDQASQLQTRLQDQFNQLEATMSQLNSQASYVSKILGTTTTSLSSSSSSSTSSSSSG
ncbi:MAG TPA: flagellar filament capping protein FliD [Kofleriaceae bacterium]|nr:flagellar filament capping protein FliD [Kofleriaceae bacterium]